MWKCARCGERFGDELSVCRTCGTPRGGEGFLARQDSSAPQAHATGNSPSDRPLTEAGFATVMLRLLGVYFTMFGIIGLISSSAHFVSLASRFGLDRAMERYYIWDYLIRPIAELLAGISLIVGGQWILSTILKSVRRRPEDE